MADSLIAIEVEQSLLGCLLRSPEKFGECKAVGLNAEWFASQKNRTVFEALDVLAECGDPIDYTIVAAQLQRWRGGRDGTALESIGGRVYLVDLAESAGGNPVAYCEILREKWGQRAVVAACDEAAAAVRNGADSSQIAGVLSGKLVQATARDDSRSFVRLSGVSGPLLEQISAIAEHRKMTGVPTGFRDVDNLTGGLQRGELIVFAGRPSMGKTALMNCCAVNQVLDGVPVGVFSSETKREEYLLRTICTHARIDSLRVKRGQMTADDRDRITESVQIIASWEYYIDDTPQIDVSQLVTKATKLVQERGVKVIYIDYLQKLGAVQRFTSEREKFDWQVQTIKKLAQTLNVPVVLASQFNRNLDTRVNKAPLLSDLKGSGQIEQEADLIIGLHRPELYIKKHGKDEGKFKNIAQAHILKQRNGPVDVVELFFQPMFTRFENMDRSTSSTEVPDI